MVEKTNPLRHALIWIAIYIGVVNLGDLLSESIGIDSSLTSILLITLSVFLLIYLRSDDRLGYYGVRIVEAGCSRHTIYYIPLLVIAFLQYVKGFDSGLGAQDIVIACVLMIGVGFIEELLFRGFLLRAILGKGTVNRAVIISGATFGIGHIVNLARGYSLADQLIQIVVGIAIGIALGYCVIIVHSIMPGVIFHILLNISGSLTEQDTIWDAVIAAMIVALLVP